MEKKTTLSKPLPQQQSLKYEKRKQEQNCWAGSCPWIGILCNPSGCIYQFATGLLQQQMCWSNCQSSLGRGRAVRKATGPPLYSREFQSSITEFLPSTSVVTVSAGDFPLPLFFLQRSKSNLVLELLCSTPLVCAWFKNLPGALLVLLENSGFCFSPINKQTKIPTPPHSPFPKI